MTIRTQPRISVNKLGEYIVASPRRRRAIIADQKNPKEFIVPRYREALEAIALFLVNGNRARLLSVRNNLAGQRFQSKWEDQCRESCIEAIDSLLRIADEIDFSAYERIRLTTPGRLSISGLTVSVRPEILLRARGNTGGLKLYIAKNTPLNEAGPYVATVLHQYMEGEHSPSRARDCFVLDVFAREIITAPRSTLRLRSEVAAACEEIVGRWNDIAA
jgi:hypothetical protein